MFPAVILNQNTATRVKKGIENQAFNSLDEIMQEPPIAVDNLSPKKCEIYVISEDDVISKEKTCPVSIEKKPKKIDKLNEDLENFGLPIF